MKILYGTTNKGKLQAMKSSVESLDIELIGLNDLDTKTRGFDMLALNSHHTEEVVT